MDFVASLRLIGDTPLLSLVFLLTLGVIFVNGWTDAPGAVATCIATRAITPRAAIALSAVGNFLGVFCMTEISSAVAFTIRDLADFGNEPARAAAALCAALFAIILWAVAAWCFGIPTSESHALVAGLTGAAIALNGWHGTIRVTAWLKVFYGLAASVILGLVLGFVCTRLVEWHFRRYDRDKVNRFFKRSQILGSFMTSFMHGAQDGQKFLGVLMLGIILGSGKNAVTLGQWAPLLCSVVMSLGTLLGGGRIIKSVGMEMVKLSPHQGFCADLAAALSLLFSTLCGFPVSTTHAKVCAVMGVGLSKSRRAVRLDTVRDMCLAWVLTFPGCGLIGFLTAGIFLRTA